MLAQWLPAQSENYRIEVNLQDYTYDSLYLAYYYGDKQYIRDTAVANTDDSFVFSGKDTIPGGMYLIVMKPENNFFQLLVDDDENRFTVNAKAADPTHSASFTDAPRNEQLYEYLNYLDEQGKKAQTIQEEMQTAESERKAALSQELQRLGAEVRSYQRELIADNPGSLLAAIISANVNVEMPTFEGTEEEVQMKRWKFTRKHYFDGMDLSDPRLLYTPFLYDRVQNYVAKLHYQIPDSIIQAIDKVLTAVEPADKTFRFFLVDFLNTYANSEVVGMDAVYVHLALNYYAEGKAPWVSEEQLAKIIENAEALEPILIGKQAPNITLEKRDGSKVSLYDVDAAYTVLYFWRYDCSHCKKSTPTMRDFYNKYKDKGVELFAVCVKYTDEVAGCWDYIDENEIGNWLHTTDKYNRSKFGSKYNIKSTPQIFILDENKEIVMKRIGAEQLEQVMEQVLKTQG